MKQNTKLTFVSPGPSEERTQQDSLRANSNPTMGRMRQRIRRIKTLLHGALTSYPPSPDKAFKQLQVIFDELEFLEKAVEDSHNQTKTSERQNSLAKQRLHFLAFHDHLTKIPNRRYFKSALEQMIDKNKSPKNFHLVFIDLDSFKAVNDDHGHEMGDWLLTQAARRLQYCVRKTDLMCRYGGDEFVLALQFCPNPEDLVFILNRILMNLTQPFNRGNIHIQVGASIGVMTYEQGMTNVEDLIHKADVAMYQAKMAGKNQICFWQEKWMNKSAVG